MDFEQRLRTWANGDSLQGKIMLGIGILLAIYLAFIYSSEAPLLRGMFIPIVLLMIITLGYGGFLAFSRPKHITTTLESYQQQKEQTIEKELKKAQTDNKNYTMLKPIWTILVVVSIILYFVLSQEYYQGLCLGLAELFIGAFLIDNFLHRRLQPYLSLLKK